MPVLMFSFFLLFSDGLSGQARFIFPFFLSLKDFEAYYNAAEPACRPLSLFYHTKEIPVDGIVFIQFGMKSRDQLIILSGSCDLSSR